MINPDPQFWAGRRVLVTGHTGFKGAWLVQWLRVLGAKVSGLSKGVLEGRSLYSSLQDKGLVAEYFVDIRDADATRDAVLKANPEIILHLAAQSLVRYSYEEPLETMATNVMGTAHVLETARALPDCLAVVCVTSDKCYENREWIWPYREDEPMGGHDPYSSSKGAAELVIASYRRSFFLTGKTGIASARAGNVFGGGDWAADRLIPDCLSAFEKKEAVEIRNPAATRPWQHVLEPLCGYLVLAEGLVRDKASFGEAWNFGPRAEDVKPVGHLVSELQKLWGENAKWKLAEGAQPHEAMSLNVDATKARLQLQWAPRLNVEKALAWTVDWHRKFLSAQCINALCEGQIEQYTNIAAPTGAGADFGLAGKN